MFPTIKTVYGEGVVIGRMDGGKILAAIAREKLVGTSCVGPVLHLQLKVCAAHKLAYEPLEGCPKCKEVSSEHWKET